MDWVEVAVAEWGGAWTALVNDSGFDSWECVGGTGLQKHTPLFVFNIT